MAGLKLPKLPDRTPVKHTVVVMPELEQKLKDYAEFYLQSYGEAESIETLIPFMLDAFLESDKGFLKSRRDKPSSTPIRQDADRQRKATKSASTPSSPEGPLLHRNSES